MKVILDTNILLAIAPKPSAYHWVFDALRLGTFDLVISTDILEEYAEKLGEWYGEVFADMVLLELTTLPNVVETTPAYFWRLVANDHDDDKFTDAYLSGNANLLVSNDSHFRSLLRADFPRVNWLLFNDFMLFLQGEPIRLQRAKRPSYRAKK